MGSRIHLASIKTIEVPERNLGGIEKKLDEQEKLENSKGMDSTKEMAQVNRQREIKSMTDSEKISKRRLKPLKETEKMAGRGPHGRLKNYGSEEQNLWIYR